jgi:hypothetical protein
VLFGPWQVIVRVQAAPAGLHEQLSRTVKMKLLTDLFSTDYGLMSISGIVFMLGMGVFFYRFFTKKMDEDAKKAAR